MEGPAMKLESFVEGIMRAPSSKVEADQIAAEIKSTPRLQEVTERMLQVIESLPHGSNRRVSLECCCGSLGLDLRPGEDMTEKEHADWMAALA